MPSFDVVCKPNLVELRNAVDQANREISNRFDFKGSDARVELADLQLVLFADDEFKLGQVRDVLLAKLAKRAVDARFLKLDTPPQKIGSDKLKQEVAVRSGLEATLAKRIVQQVKDSKLKVTAGIQGDAVRVAGAKKDLLQECIALIRKQVTDVPISFDNFRD
jgi:cyclic-di-GMP-binding protein